MPEREGKYAPSPTDLRTHQRPLLAPQVGSEPDLHGSVFVEHELFCPVRTVGDQGINQWERPANQPASTSAGRDATRLRQTAARNGTRTQRRQAWRSHDSQGNPITLDGKRGINREGAAFKTVAQSVRERRKDREPAACGFGSCAGLTISERLRACLACGVSRPQIPVMSARLRTWNSGGELPPRRKRITRRWAGSRLLVAGGWSWTRLSVRRLLVRGVRVDFLYRRRIAFDMETVKSVVEFLNSYPFWAKSLAVLGLVLTIGTLLLAPRIMAEPSDKKPGAASGEAYLSIRGVNLYPEDEKASIQATAFVNGIPFTYPSLAGVEWLNVGPSMSSQWFKLPKSDGYALRFEMKLRSPHQPEKKLASVEEMQVKAIPFSGVYQLHVVQGITRAAGVTADIRFTVEYR